MHYKRFDMRGLTAWRKWMAHGISRLWHQGGPHRAGSALSCCRVQRQNHSWGDGDSHHLPSTRGKFIDSGGLTARWKRMASGYSLARSRRACSRQSPSHLTQSVSKTFHRSQLPHKSVNLSLQNEYVDKFVWDLTVAERL